jgi:hypothetical protein
MLVDLVGIEPTTSSMPWKRAPSCATGPLVSFNSRLGLPWRQTRLGECSSTRIWWIKHKDTIWSPMLTSRNILFRSLFFLAPGVIVVLSAAAACAQGAAAASSSAPSTQPPVAYASVSELNSILTQLQKTAQGMQTDLGNMRIEKWKTGASTKQETLSNVQSIERNLQSALPAIITELNNSPEDVAVSFKLYRNLDALYDVFGSVVESAGAFGSKEEFQNLSNDMTGLENARRAFGERMQKLAASKEDELTRLRAQVKTLSAAPPPPPKKIVVDDTEPPKKPAAKKKVTKPKPPATTPAAPTNTPPSASPTSN